MAVRTDWSASKEMPSHRELILRAIGTRLETIRVASGFATDAGLRVFHGPVRFGPDDPPIAIAVVPGGTTTTSDPRAVKKTVHLPVDIHAMARDDLDHPLLVVESVIADIKTALEVEDRSLGGLAKDFRAGEVLPLPRAEGSTTIGSRVEYLVLYIELWGDPSA
jgi:hypothetical protein